MIFSTSTILAVLLYLKPLQCINRWSQVTFTGDRISARSGHASSFYPTTNEFLVFGGVDSSNNFNNELYSINIVTMISVKITTLATSTPVSRAFAAYTSDRLTGNFYIHGGTGVGLVEFADFWRFNPVTRLWSSLSISYTGAGNAVNVFTARQKHCMDWDTSSNRLIMHGGSSTSRQGLVIFSGLFTYNTQMNQWRLENSDVPKYAHACATDSKNQLFYIYAGLKLNANSPDELFEFNLNTKQMVAFDTTPTTYGVSGHFLKFMSDANVLLSFMGQTYPGTDVFATAVFQFNLSDYSPGKWYTQVGVNAPLPPARSSFAASFVPSTNEVLIFGGSSGVRGLTFNDLWRFQFQRPPPSSVVTTANPLSRTTTTEPVMKSSSTSEIPESVEMSLESETVSTTDLSTGTFLTSSNHVNETSVLKINISRARLSVSSPTRQPSQSNFFTENYWSVIVLAIGLLLTIIIVTISCRMRKTITAKFTKKVQATRKMNFRSEGIELRQVSSPPPVETIMPSPNDIGRSFGDFYQSEGTATFGSLDMTQVTNERGLSLPGYLKLDSLKDFKLKKTLTSGGYGKIYLAEALDKQFQKYGNVVVIKELIKVTTDEVDAFHQEVSLMEYFKSCMNVAKIVAYSDSPYSLVMKFYCKGTLADMLEKMGKKIRPFLFSFAKDIAQGIMCLHQKGVVHNDLKPENVLMDTDTIKRPLCVLTDFGISQVVT